MKVQHAIAAVPFVGILVGMFFANSVEPGVRAEAGTEPRFSREPAAERVRQA